MKVGFSRVVVGEMGFSEYKIVDVCEFEVLLLLFHWYANFLLILNRFNRYFYFSLILKTANSSNLKVHNRDLLGQIHTRMQGKNRKEFNLFSFQNNPQTLGQCLEVYRKLKGAQSIRKKLKIPEEEHQSYTQKNSASQNKYKALLNQYLENHITFPQSLPNNLSLQQNFIDSSPQISEHQYKITELIQINQQIQTKQQQMSQKQAQYKQLMKKHYKFVRINKPQEIFHKYVKDKLLKNLSNLQHEIHQLYEIGARSSISSSSYNKNHDIEDWINQQKQDKILKEHQKLNDQIDLLEKQLASIE